MHWNWYHTLSVNKHLLKNLTDTPQKNNNNKTKNSYDINQMVFTIHRRTNKQKQEDIFLFTNKHNMPALTPSLPQPVKLPGWKMHGRAWKQYIFPVLWHVYFQCYEFWWQSFHVPCEKRSQKSLMVSNFPVGVACFQVTSWQWRG